LKMAVNPRDLRAAARHAARQNQAAALVAEFAEEVEDEDEGLPVPNPEVAVAAPAGPIAVDPGMWLSMVNVKPPQLADLEIESMKKFILDYKRYAQKCPEQLLRSMQQFILEDHLDVIIENSEMARREVMGLNRDGFIQIMLQMHQANSSRKWRLLVKNARMEKTDLTLSTFTNYVEDFKFWIQVAGEPHKVPEKELAKMFVSGLKPDIFRAEISSRACESLRDAIAESRAELAVYRELLDITERMKKSEVKKSTKDSGPSEAPKKPGKSFTPIKTSPAGKTKDLKDVECFHCHKKGHYANKCPEIKVKDAKGAFKVRKVEEDKPEEKVARQVRIRYADMKEESKDDFIRYWIRVLDLGDVSHLGEHEG
jgi:hypothetical protein